jgi:hypothetical protein
MNQTDQRHIYTEYTDMGHVIWDKTYDDIVLHRWLFSQKKDIGTNVKGESLDNLRNEYYLSQNYPNPFNPTTKIKYSIHEQSNVTIKVFDVLGSEIKTKVNREQSRGIYEIEFNPLAEGLNLSSGIYFYRLRACPASGGAGDFMYTRKMLLIK